MTFKCCSLTKPPPNLCPSQCWASTSAQPVLVPTSPSLWRAGGACWTGSGPLRRRSLCPVMLCPLNRLVRANKYNFLDQPMCLSLDEFESNRRFVLSRWQWCFCDWHRPLQKPCFYSVLPEVNTISLLFYVCNWPSMKYILWSQDGAPCWNTHYFYILAFAYMSPFFFFVRPCRYLMSNLDLVSWMTLTV